jgi:hypothetical protein
MVDDGFGLDLDELDAPEMGCIEGPASQLEKALVLHWRQA